MPTEKHDIEAMLETEIKYYLGEAARCQRALAAYRGETSGQDTQQKTSGWAAAIDEVFKTGEVLNIDEVRDRLSLQGLPAHDDQYINTIRSTLARKASKGGTLKRVDIGEYRLKTQADGIIDLDDENNEGAEPGNDSDSL